MEKLGRVLKLALVRRLSECLTRHVSLELHRMLGVLDRKARIISEMLVARQSALSLEQGERLTDEGGTAIAPLQIYISVELLNWRNFLLDIKVSGRLNLRLLGETILELSWQL